MKKEFEYYNNAAPVKTERILGGEFKYRYYKNPSPEVNATIVMLAGGTGLGDLRNHAGTHSKEDFTYLKGRC